MRVALVCPYSLAHPGGVQGQVLGLARALRTPGGPARGLRGGWGWRAPWCARRPARRGRGDASAARPPGAGWGGPCGGGGRRGGGGGGWGALSRRGGGGGRGRRSAGRGSFPWGGCGCCA